MARLSRPAFQSFEEGGSVILEKVEIHRIGDVEDEVAVQGRFVENLIDMVARAANLTRQPACAALVGLQLRLYKMPDARGHQLFAMITATEVLAASLLGSPWH